MTTTTIPCALLESGGLGSRWQNFLRYQNPGSDGALRFHYGTHPAQIGHLRGARYWQSMTMIYTHAHAALPVGGRMILILKDHIRDQQRVCTVETTIDLCATLGFQLIDRVQRRVHPLSLWQRRRKECGELIVEEEDTLILEVC